MRRCPTPRLLAVIVAALCILLFAVSGFAQFQTGNIFGKVQTKDGSVLPGVTVTLTGVGAPKTAVTDATGSFRFINLDPGTYTVKAELAGYGTATRSGIGVRVAQNADVTLTVNPSVAESITVTAEAPLLDVRKAGTGIDVSNVELQNIPTGRDPWVVMQQTPGVLMDRINVGGNESGQQSGYVSKGATSDQSAWNVDGVSITDVGALGSTPTYYDFDSFEEIQITTGGSDPRIKTPGIQMNFVTKRGTNDFKGNAHWFQTEDTWQADPSIPSEASSYLSTVNQIDRIEDRGIDVGGPILRDRLWFWGAFSRNNVNLLTSTFLGTGNRFVDKTLLQNENIKINAQPFSSNSFVLTDMYGEKVKNGRNVSPSRPPETAWNQADVYRGKEEGDLFNPTTWKIEDTQIFGSSLYLTGMYSEVQGGFHLVAATADNCTTLDCALAGPVAAFDEDAGHWIRNFYNYETLRPSSQARIDGSKFFDIGNTNHELKFGFGYRHAGVQSTSAWAGNQYTDCCFDTAGTGLVFLQRSPLTNFHYKVQYEDAYVGDTILMGNLTIQAALRWDQQKGSVQSGSLGANPQVPDLLPAISWGEFSGLKWTDISPRIGLTYALGQQKRTLVRASYNRYAGQLGGSDVYAVSPGYYNYGYAYFTDVNGDKTAQSGEIDFSTFSPVLGINPTDPSAPFVEFRWDKGFDAPTTDEFILGFETELMPDFSVGVNGTYRNLKNFSWQRAEKTQGAGDFYTPADFVPTTVSCDNGNTVSGACAPFGSASATVYRLAPGVPAPQFWVIQNRPDYHQTYESVDLFAVKRLSSRWMLRGNLTLQDWKNHVGQGGMVNPTRMRDAYGCSNCDGSDVVIGAGSGSGAKGGIYINSKWAYNITGTYQIPVIETNFGFNINGRQGYVVPYVLRVTAANESGVGAGSYLYPLVENNITDTRLPDIFEVDLRLAKEFHFWRSTGLTVSVDGFNVLNRQTILQRDVGRINASSSNRITELMSPRVFRLGARLSF